ncbi:MAG: hypothetical protein JWQ04_3457 [Pedosphaera sp.]|nr:hypothetical protein [Pedosphaera sp.]
MNNYWTGKWAGILWRGLAVWLCLSASFSVGKAAGEPDETSSPLKLYNDGTRKLSEGKFQEAEACLQGAVASQSQRVQGPALYNLGEVRFRAGAQDLKKAENDQAVGGRSKQASETGSGAIQAADQALAGDDVLAMVEAYMRGRGARKELKGAMEAVKAAMETYGGVLAKWRRASGDFKGDYELSPRDLDAKTNADLVDQNIAKLVDRQQMMMQMMQGMSKQRSDLGKKMAELKKKMPKDKGDQMKGGEDEDDDDEDGKKPPPEPKQGQEEPGPKEGKETMLTFEEAARLLDMLKLDGNRKLPLGTNGMGKPGDRKGRDW